MPSLHYHFLFDNLPFPKIAESRDVHCAVNVPSPRCLRALRKQLQQNISPGELLLFSHQVVFDSLQSHGLQHTRIFYSSLAPRVCSDSCPLNRWCYLTISSFVASFSSCPQSFPASGSFPMSWPKYLSSSISPSNEYSALISFRIGWFELLADPRDSQESSPALQFKSISSSVFNLLYGPTLTSVQDYWKNLGFSVNFNRKLTLSGGCQQVRPGRVPDKLSSHALNCSIPTPKSFAAYTL